VSSTALWYLDRATGLVALGLMTLTVVLGVVVQRQRRLPGLPRAGGVLLHRNVSLLSAVFLALHVVSAAADTVVPVGWPALVLPFVSGWRPLAVGLGTVAVDLLVLVVLTSLVRRRIPVRVWRWVHLTSYALWPLAFLHGLTAGTDLGSGWALVPALACAAAAGGATAVALTGRRTPAPDRAPAAVAAATAALRRGDPVPVFRNR
jgi:sulfoxide reductase heme-binding subunit YedZ